MNNLESHLFETNAVKVCHGDKPFWLTSGKLSAYFINTHFVYGSEADANDLLTFINENKNDALSLPKKLLDKVKLQYDNNKIYRTVIDEMVSFVKNNISLEDIDYVSGGERRDWFFSIIISYLLDKPHITIYKDSSAYISDSKMENTEAISSIAGKKVLHVTDLITYATSFIRSWIPAIQNLGGELIWALSVVDRMQGGKERLEDLGIKSYSLVGIDEGLFKDAFENGLIDDVQFDLVCKFIKDPDESMEKFVREHPEYIEESLHSDANKKDGRVQLCIDSHFYGL